MLRTAVLVGLALATVGGAVAGTVLPVNLTTQTVYEGACSTLNCVPSVTNQTGAFQTKLFTNIYGASTPGLPTPSTSPQNTSNPASTAFILAAQTGSTNNGDDTFVSANTANMDTEVSINLGTCTLLQPTTTCGLQNIDSIYTMLQGTGTYGQIGMVLTVTGQSSGGTPISDSIYLTSGIDYRSTNSLLAQTCDAANAGSTAGSSCTGQSSDTAQSHATDSSPASTGGPLGALANPIPGAAVTVYNNAFGTLTNGTRNFYFDVQNISLGSLFLNGGYLDSITLENFSGATATQMIVNGLSVSATPEPSSVVLMGLGAGLLAFAGIRSKRSRRQVSE